MKSNILAIFIVLFLLVGSLFAANTDRYYQGTVAIGETYSSLVYTWTVTLVQDSTDQLHSPAMLIADANDNYGLATCIVSAASDVNVIWHYSSDGVTWYTAVTPAGLDASTNSAKQDTIGYQSGAADYSFAVGRWLIVEIDGGSNAANLGEIVTVQVALRKDKYSIDGNGDMKKLGLVYSSKPARFTNP